jgi:hypothetical protein
VNRPLLLALVTAACAADSGSAGDDTPTPDAPQGCAVSLLFDPQMAVADPSTEVRVVALVDNAPGVLQYTWTVTHGGGAVTFAYAQPDQSAITFAVPDPGPYSVMVAVGGTSGLCPTAQGAINVGVPGGNLAQVRLRVYPPPSVLAPPAEKLVLVPGGAPFTLGTVPVEPGIEVTGHVRMGTIGVPAYLRFIPLGGRDAFVETFAQSDGAFRVRVLAQLHDVLVVPLQPGYAPRLVESWLPAPGAQLLPIDGGTQISGRVLDPAGNALASTHVQLVVDGVPSTLTTTDASGNFVVRASVPAGAPDVRVEVTPPASSGLPRIRGGATSLTAAGPFTIRYAPALVRRDLGGVVVRRDGAAQANVPVKIVGTLGAVATITAGASVPASGEVRIATTTTATGAIPNGTLAPAAPLTAVTTIGSQLAIDTIDLTASVPSTIDAPPAVLVVSQLRSPAQPPQPLPNAVLELQPAGALALAGAPTLRSIADAAGNTFFTVPPGGTFHVRAWDPLARGAQLRLENVPTASLASGYVLGAPLHVTGSLMLSGNATPVGRAAVQILCTLCDGAERSRPIAEGASTGAGSFDVAIVDPGVTP